MLFIKDSLVILVLASTGIGLSIVQLLTIPRNNSPVLILSINGCISRSKVRFIVD
jgi:hypothetical protein